MIMLLFMCLNAAVILWVVVEFEIVFQLLHIVRTRKYSLK